MAGFTADITANRIVDLNLVNYTISTLVYPIKIIEEMQFKTLTHDNDVQTRPGIVYLENFPNYSQLTFYPIPDQNYAVEIRAKLMLDQIVEHQDLTAIPPYYYQYLKYRLARQLLAYYPSANWPATAEEDYQEMKKRIEIANPHDVTIRQSQILTTPQPYYWQTILVN